MLSAGFARPDRERSVTLPPHPILLPYSVLSAMFPLPYFVFEEVSLWSIGTHEMFPYTHSLPLPGPPVANLYALHPGFLLNAKTNLLFSQARPPPAFLLSEGSRWSDSSFLTRLWASLSSLDLHPSPSSPPTSLGPAYSVNIFPAARHCAEPDKRGPCSSP